MPIKLNVPGANTPQSDPAPTQEASPHAQAAQNLQQEQPKADATVTTTVTDGQGNETHDTQQLPVDQPAPVNVPALFNRVKMGASFRFPVAPYTMMEYQISLDHPCEIGEENECFTYVRGWVEDNLNTLVAEQQEVAPEQAGE